MNMYDYISWRGDLPFSKDPFNIVDNLLFSYIIYTDLSAIAGYDSEGITIRQAGEKYFETHTEEEILKSTSFIAQAPLVLRAMGSSRRFGDIRIRYYVHNIDREKVEQFSAAHFLIDNSTSYIAYAGTDDTFVGWKEDFQMSYQTISAQISAADYLNRTATGMFHRYYLGGHSKGGNLAEYAGVHASDKVRKKIIRVFSNDGPGLADYAMDQEGYEKIKDRFTKIVPELSVFGMLYDRNENRIVIRSDKTGIMQHDAIGWQILGTDFVRAEKLDDNSNLIQQGIREFLNTIDVKQRKEVVEQMFDAFDKAGIENTTDFAEKGIPVIRNLLRELFNVNQQAKDAFGTLVSIFSHLVSEKTKAFFRRKRDETVSSLGQTVSTVKDKYNETVSSLGQTVNTVKERYNETVSSIGQTVSSVTEKVKKAAGRKQ